MFPVIPEGEKARIKRSLCIMLPAVIAAGLLFGIFFSINSPDDSRKWLIFSVSLFSLPSWWLAKKNYLRLSALLFIFVLWAILSIGVAYSGGGISVGHGGFLLLVFMSGLLLSGRYTFIILLMSLTSITWVIYTDSYGQLPESPSSKPINLWVVFNLYLIIGWAVLALTMRHVRSVIAKSSLELGERMRTEQALRESQERLDLALSSAHMGILDWQIDTDLIHWSHQACEIWGLSGIQKANSLEKMLQCIYPADKEKVRLEIGRAFEKGSPNFYTEHRVALKSGEICWVSLQGDIYYNAQGAACRMTGTTADITIRKQSEQAILDAHRRLNAYTDTLEERSGLLLLGAEVARAATAILNPRALSQQVVELVQKQFDLYYVGLFLVESDPQWAILRAGTGDAGQKMLAKGHRLEIAVSSMIGWCILNRKARIALDVGEDAVRFSNPLLPDTRSELALPLVSRGEVVGALTIQSNKPDTFTPENMVSFETMADLLANAVLNARFYEQLQAELEERKHVEDKIRHLNIELESRVKRRTTDLRASEEKFRALAENNPLQIARYNREARYLYVNHWIDQEKHSTEQVIGKTMREIFGSHASVDFAEEKIREVFDTGKPVKIEYEFNNFVGLWSLAPEFDPQGNVVSVISSTLDITDRKRTEEELRQRSAELQASNRELEAFSYSVSHDLRAPLRAIDGFTRILMDDFASQIPEEGMLFLQRTRSAAQNMGQLIDDLLRLSRITRAEINRQWIDLGAIARAILEELQSAEPHRSAEIFVETPLKLRGDDRLLRVALENLLNNAWKFTSKNAQASIKVGKIIKKGKNTYYVRDNGVGFSMNYIDKLFSPFQRLHTLEEFPGTGIGLAIVKRIIHKHGGEIWVESEPGKGAAFYFTLG